MSEIRRKRHFSANRRPDEGGKGCFRDLNMKAQCECIILCVTDILFE